VRVCECVRVVCLGKCTGAARARTCGGVWRHLRIETPGMLSSPMERTLMSTTRKSSEFHGSAQKGFHQLAIMFMESSIVKSTVNTSSTTLKTCIQNGSDGLDDVGFIRVLLTYYQKG